MRKLLIFAAFVIFAAIASTLGCQNTASTPADLVLTGGVIRTMDADRTVAEAIAVQGDRIIALGSSEDAKAWIGRDTEVVELAGATVLPGLIESHGHFLGFGETLTQVDLTDAVDFEDVVARVAAAAAQAEPGSWIRGFGWHQEKWRETPADAVGGFPVHDSLSARTPDHPVFLSHASGHAALVNAKAMELAAITADTAAPEGGEILLGAHGEPTGLLNESAENLAVARMEVDLGRDEHSLRAAAEAAAAESLAHGVTTFVDAGTTLATLHALGAVADEGELGVRLWAMIRDSNDNLSGEPPQPSDWFRVGGIKVSLDGALGSRGAWLLEDYTDAPGQTGLQQVSLESLRETANIARDRGLQLCVHAIGDRANREILDLYEEFLDSQDRSPRWRVEHAQHLHPEDIPRFAALDVVASVQGVHCTSDGPWVPTRLGERRAREGGYVWRLLLDSGALVVNGTDVPVEAIDPFANLESSVTRVMGNGEAFYPDQVMTVEEALRSYTIDGAYAIFAEDELGSLTPGKLADLIVLDRDPVAVPSSQLSELRVLRTVVGGQTRYLADQSE